ncbi:Sec-independent protein translocase subunit TatA [Streptomyces sp. NPDC059467]|uniref:Sec-independent protein translocase subunit TatA n=1 Tax=Streptomyces sp. NPDC059467 TaxID=3346844 RepID=UPI0036A0CF71
MLRNGLEPWHLLVVAIVFIALFGSRKLPDTARALGKSLRVLKSEAKALKTGKAPGAPVEPTSVQMAAEPTATPVQPRPRPAAEPTATAG